jgi:hypothetical protein
MPMISLNIRNYIDYCMGFSYLDKPRYADELAANRTENRLWQNQFDQLMSAVQNMSLQPAPSADRTPVWVRRVQNALQETMQFFIFRPFQQVVNLITPLFQATAAAIGGVVAKTTGMLEKAMSQVLSFFYGFKKDRNEEKERRDKDDFKDTDLFTRRVVDSSFGAGGQSAGGR